MRPQSLCLISLLLMAGITLGACQKDQPPETNSLSEISPTSGLKDNQAASSETSNEQPDSSEFGVMIDDVGEYLKQAEQSFIRNDKTQAVKEISQAAILLDQQYDSASPMVKANIKDVVEDLSAIAERINKDEITSVQELEPVFEQAHQINEIEPQIP